MTRQEKIDAAELVFRRALDGLGVGLEQAGLRYRRALTEAQDDPEPVVQPPAPPGVLEAAREAIKRVAIYSRVYVDLLDEDGWDSKEGKAMAHALCALRDASTEQRVRKECMAALPQATPVPVKVSVDRGVVSKWALRISHAPTEDGVAGCVLPLNGKCRMSAGRMLVSLLQLLGVPAVLESEVMDDGNRE